MKAMQLFDLGQKLKLVDVPIPIAKGNEVQIKIEAVGINFADLLICEGKYQVRPELPFSPGMEVCGTITDLGPECQGFQKCDRIVGFGNYGGLAEYTTLPQNHCLQISNKLADVEAAGFMVAYGTSHVALSHRAGLTSGENLLVLGASGGVGRTAVEIGHLMGANVIAAASNDDKLHEAKRSGANHLINTSTEDLLSKIKSLGGADVVYDPVGGELFKQALRATNPEGRIIPIGFASGE
ncbi:MAG: NADPH:quinone oxidoreductase family protein, partial [Rhodobacteraceae bacterium]|nr:NADPH:quinone oxidoreductase family protein [Paracoccaceae bacterium]